MSAASAPADHGAMSESRVMARDIAALWWLWLATGIAWLIAALVVLQFDSASITTIGIIVGCLFCFAALQQMTLFALGARPRWLWAVFGVLFLIAGIVCFVNPEATFVGLADILGFCFLMVGVWWTVDAFVQREDNPLWWVGLMSGALMLILAFWTSGQFFIEKAYALVAFAGIWALMQGFTDIVRAFRLRGLRDEV
jgi:uncharacterized membrane protein HdeD (DUF308 family)